VWIFLEASAADRQFLLRDARLMRKILETVAARCATVWLQFGCKETQRGCKETQREGWEGKAN
jgi:hypothetical protein